MSEGVRHQSPSPYTTNQMFRKSSGFKEPSKDLISDKLINNKNTWETRVIRPVSGLSSKTAEKKVSTGEQPTISVKLSDYLPPSKYLVETMDKLFVGEPKQRETLFGSKIINNTGFSTLGPAQQLAKSVSQERMTRSQYLQKSQAIGYEILMPQPLTTSGSRKQISAISSAHRDTTFRQQIKYMKQDFSKFMQRRKLNT